ncbi:MAG TPA: glycosyltransferase family 2 protein [Gaiellaceae bacterium]|nr:glycosyltransferase family 2 protein [Gaiellaceae bacterium]
MPGERIAVVIPCFNDGATLRETIASIDEPEPIELVVVDDGSTDPETLAVLAELETAGTRVVHQENAGLSAARMAGVRATSAPYVSALDADDLEASGALGALADALDADPTASVAWGDVKNFGEDETYRRLGRSLDPWLITYVNELPADAMVRREALLAAGGWELKGGYEDWDLWMALAERGARGIHVPVVTGWYRVRSNRMLADTQTRHEDMLALLRSRHPQLFAGRPANRRRSGAPLRCKLLLPLVDRLPLGAYTKQRLFRLVNRPGAALRARL